MRCMRCVMDDNSDNTITFDENGICNYCTNAFVRMPKEYFPNEEGNRKLQELLLQIKNEGKGKKYDCIMGLSGGLDSSYLAYLGSKWGLRILAVHVDDGFDTEISKKNLECLVKKTGFDYQVIRPDEKQFCALTKAFMISGVPNLAAPQDNILFANIYKLARKYGIKYFLSGSNFALESILQRGNMHSAYDVYLIKDIAKKFSNEHIDKLEFISTLKLSIERELLGMKTLAPLDFVDYNRDRAFEELKDFCGFEYYGRKHLENTLTAFVQLYWFPIKFGVDKRTSHLSSMIVSGQLSREEALKELEKPIVDDIQLKEYINILKSKLKMSEDEFDNIMNAPSHDSEDYRTEDKVFLYNLIALVKPSWVGYIRSKFRR